MCTSEHLVLQAILLKLALCMHPASRLQSRRGKSRCVCWYIARRVDGRFRLAAGLGGARYYFDKDRVLHQVHEWLALC
jgi:hypothetical protein